MTNEKLLALYEAAIIHEQQSSELGRADKLIKAMVVTNERRNLVLQRMKENADE